MMKRKMMAVVLTMAMTTAMAAGCSGSSDTSGSGEDSYTIGISRSMDPWITAGRASLRAWKTRASLREKI